MFLDALGVYGSVKNACLWLIDYLVSFAEGWMQSLVDVITQALPDMSGSYETFQNALNFANSWIPLDYAYTLVAAYISISMILYMARHILKLIPGLG